MSGAFSFEGQHFIHRARILVPHCRIILMTGHATLFLNVDPLVFERDTFVETVTASAAAAGMALDRIVLEVTERSGFVDEEAAVSAFERLRKTGVRFALDDHGSAYSHLGLIDQIQPSFIKISSHFGSDFELHSTRQRVVNHTLSLARDFGCETILEGVETAETARAAEDLGVRARAGILFRAARVARSAVTARVWRSLKFTARSV